MENPIALMLLMGAAGRQQGLDPAMIGEAQKILLNATEAKKDAEAEAKPARQEVESTKNLYEKKDKLQADMKAEMDRCIPIANTAAPRRRQGTRHFQIAP